MEIGLVKVCDGNKRMI